MVRFAFVTGTYSPKHCGVAHYTAHLRQHLEAENTARSANPSIANQPSIEQDFRNPNITSIVLTTQAAAQTGDRTIIGAVQDWQLSDLLPLVKAIQSSQVDLLHIQHAAGSYEFKRAIFLLPLLLKLAGWRSPIVTTVHEYGWWDWQPAIIPKPMMQWLKLWGQKRGWWDQEDGFLLTLSDAIITTNHDAEQAIASRLPQLKQKLTRIPIGANVEVSPIDRNQARQQVQQCCGWSDEVAIAAFFGFLHPVKGLETLLPAFQRVLESLPQARLLLVGGVESLALPGEQATQYWEQLQQRLTELGLTQQVHMTGYQPAELVSTYLMASDVGVLPFNHGVTLKSGSLLALGAHRLPVIATHTTPTDPELEQEPWITWVPPRNVTVLADVLANALKQSLSNPKQQQQLGATGDQFSQQFNWTTIAHHHVEIYQNLLAGSGK